MTKEVLINKTTLLHLANLSRLTLTPKEYEQYQKDLKKILDYFNDLKKADTDGVDPMNGGTHLVNVFREDVVDLEKKAHSISEVGRIIEAFPESEKGSLKVPKVL